MMDYEPITKGLRERLEVAVLGLAKPLADEVLAEFDNIDAIHRSLEAENERMRKAQDDWIKLPVDADGVPIRVGDMLAEGEASPERVQALMFYRDGWSVNFGLGWCVVKYHKWHHVKPDTWESIIKDATKLGFTDPDNEHIAHKLVARCKALCERTREVGE